jgi:hypothetical protein
MAGNIRYKDSNLAKMNMKMPHLKHDKKAAAHTSGLKTALHRIGRDPYMDWTLIFVITVIATAIFIFLGFVTFRNAQARLEEGGAPSDIKTAFDGKSMSQLLGKFDSRADERALLQKGYDGPVDPSL